jgi:flagellar protein FliO/FliZ
MKRLLLATSAVATTFIVHAQAASAAAASASEKQPVNLPVEQAQQASTAGSNSSGLLRTMFGLFVVIAVIYGLYWILKQVKKSKEQAAVGSGLRSLATLPLGPNRSLHMIRAGREIVLVGVAEHGVAPIRSYTEDEAYEAGLIDGPDDGDDDAGSSTGGAAKTGKAAFASPLQAVTGALEGLRQRTVRK